LVADLLYLSFEVYVENSIVVDFFNNPHFGVFEGFFTVVDSSVSLFRDIGDDHS
jgi:hypothetical protein